MAVGRALTLNPDLGAAHAAMARIQMFDYDWTAANASCKRALALEPGDADIIGLVGLLASYLGQLDDAVALCHRAMLIDPLNPSVARHAGIALYYAGRLEEAKSALHKALELTPGLGTAQALLGLVFLEQARPEEALAEVQKEKAPFWREYGLALAHHALGRKKESDANLAKLIAKSQADAPYQIAEVCAFRAEADRAFDWLQRAYIARDPALSEIKADPLLKSLRRDPRFAALLKKMGLPL